MEFDGVAKYSLGGGDPLQRLRDEKARADRLGDLGYELARVTWQDLDRPGVIAARVRAALTRAAGKPAPRGSYRLSIVHAGRSVPVGPHLAPRDTAA